MLENQGLEKSLYLLEKIKVIRLKNGAFIVRGSFLLRPNVDSTKRFILLKRQIPNLSYLRFKEITFLRPNILIDLEMQIFSKEDMLKIKNNLWYKLSLYLQNKMQDFSVAEAI
ncbi:MAG: hypothetical protein HQ564_06225 [Candidatus Saganbacteria bacterium]|nr:hypothetical protein [Candidatus Saganbacteria bacterium]